MIEWPIKRLYLALLSSDSPQGIDVPLCLCFIVSKTAGRRLHHETLEVGGQWYWDHVYTIWAKLGQNDHHWVKECNNNKN